MLFGLAMGGLYAVAYYLIYRRTQGSIRPRTLALVLAAGALVSFYLVPFVKYPANPPAIGHADTIGDRSMLYLGMVVISVVAFALAAIAARGLAARFGTWNATLLAGLGFLVVIGIAMAVLPPLGHLHYNQVHFGDYSTETPQPLLDSRGAIVYPGFPADVLFRFRLYSVISQLILWGTIGLAFGPLIERVVKYQPERRDPGALATRPA